MAFVEKNHVRILVPQTNGVVFTPTVKVAIKHVIIINNNGGTNARVRFFVGPIGNELPFFPRLNISRNGFFQWDGWDILEVGEQITMKSNQPNVYVHISGAEV